MSNRHKHCELLYYFHAIIIVPSVKPDTNTVNEDKDSITNIKKFKRVNSDCQKRHKHCESLYYCLALIVDPSVKNRKKNCIDQLLKVDIQ